MSAKSMSLSVVCYNWDRENCPLYGVAGCPLFRDCLSIEGNGRAIKDTLSLRSNQVSFGQSGLSGLSVISWVSAIQGCPLSGVPLYYRAMLAWEFNSQ